MKKLTIITNSLSCFTACERTLHTKCVINIGSSKEFRIKCKPDSLLKCLRDAFKNKVCIEHDKDTIPTIRQLIGMVERKFKHDPGFCNSDKKFDVFIERIQDTFTG